MQGKEDELAQIRFELQDKVGEIKSKQYTITELESEVKRLSDKNS